VRHEKGRAVRLANVLGSPGGRPNPNPYIGVLKA
jgi:hypothetical protein